MDPLKALEDTEAFEKRLEEIDELLPLKYRYPKTYRPRSYDYRAESLPPIRASSVPPLRASSVPPLTPLRAMTPLRTYTPPSRHPSEKVGYDYSGLPIYSRGALGRRALSELLEPSTWLPRSRITTDPWWWDYPSLRPYYSPLYYGRAPYYLRSSYLSPIKRTYMWGVHPLRPFNTEPWWWDYATSRPFQSHYYYLRRSYFSPVNDSYLWSVHPFKPYSDPWWWDYPSLRPYFSPLDDYYAREPYYLRKSFLSPVNRRYLWSVHPVRPFNDPWWLDYTLRSAYRTRYYGTTPYVLHSSYTIPVKSSHVWNTEPFSDPWWWDYPSMKSHLGTITRLRNPVKRVRIWTTNPRWEYNSIRYWV